MYDSFLGIRLGHHVGGSQLEPLHGTAPSQFSCRWKRCNERLSRSEAWGLIGSNQRGDEKGAERDAAS